MSSPWWTWTPRLSASGRKAMAAMEKRRLAKAGKSLEPVEPIRGNKIATTFWGKSWCQNLERYSDFANRLPRGRSYVRSGSVVHLSVGAGQIEALVSGSSLYEVTVTIRPVAKAAWSAICRDGAGAIDSLVALLDGKFSESIMDRLCRKDGGLFPSPKDIQFSCSCPDGAWMCKHVAAVLYGVGARLDAKPALLFRMRKVDENEMLAGAAKAAVPAKRKAKGSAPRRKDLAAMFGLELAPVAKGRKRAPVSRSRAKKTPPSKRSPRR